MSSRAATRRRHKRNRKTLRNKARYEERMPERVRYAGTKAGRGKKRKPPARQRPAERLHAKLAEFEDR